MKRTCMPMFLVCLAMSAVVGSAAQPDLTKLPAPSKQKGVAYSKDIRPILEASCFRCHGERGPKGGLRLDTLEGVLKGSEEGKVVVPGKSAESSLVIAVSQLNPDNAMPPKPRSGQGPGGPPPKPLTAEEVGLVRAWIDQGAK